MRDAINGCHRITFKAAPATISARLRYRLCGVVEPAHQVELGKNRTGLRLATEKLLEKTCLFRRQQFFRRRKFFRIGLFMCIAVGLG